MDSYVAVDVTEKARALGAERAPRATPPRGCAPGAAAKPFPPPHALARALHPSAFAGPGQTVVRSVDRAAFGDFEMDLGWPQLVEVGQTRALAEVLTRTLTAVRSPTVSLR